MIKDINENEQKEEPNSKFPLREKLGSHYTHVDNGGYTFSIWAEGEYIAYLQLEESYYGYSSHDIRFHHGVSPENLRSLSEMFLHAADELDKRMRK